MFGHRGVAEAFIRYNGLFVLNFGFRTSNFYSSFVEYFKMFNFGDVV